MRLTSLLFIFALFFTLLPAHASQTWRGDMLANASWNEESRLEGIVHYPRPNDMFRKQEFYGRQDADLFDRAELKHAPRTDMFPQKHRARPDQKLFDGNF